MSALTSGFIGLDHVLASERTSTSLSSTLKGVSQHPLVSPLKGSVLARLHSLLQLVRTSSRRTLLRLHDLWLRLCCSGLHGRKPPADLRQLLRQRLIQDHPHLSCPAEMHSSGGMAPRTEEMKKAVRVDYWNLCQLLYLQVSSRLTPRHLGVATRSS